MRAGGRERGTYVLFSPLGARNHVASEARVTIMRPMITLQLGIARQRR